MILRISNPPNITSLTALAWPYQPLKERGRTWYDDFGRLSLLPGNIDDIYTVLEGTDQDVDILNSSRLALISKDGTGNNRISSVATLAPVWKDGGFMDPFTPMAQVECVATGFESSGADADGRFGICAPHTGAQIANVGCVAIRCHNNIAGEQTWTLFMVDSGGIVYETPIGNAPAGTKANLALYIERDNATAIVGNAAGGEIGRANRAMINLGGQGLNMAVESWLNTNGSGVYLDRWGARWS